MIDASFLKDRISALSNAYDQQLDQIAKTEGALNEAKYMLLKIEAEEMACATGKGKGVKKPIKK